MRITISYDILSVGILIRCNFGQDISVGGLSLEVEAARVKHPSVKLV